ncbi:hypothetical protein V9W64_05880 [Neisseria leonii]|uniref:Uncharacterized protein n=1 Tax=Neisseria leonii TaxID=2995413 RepID=A0A9X4IEI5_9NEIS|nr:hypothetical protein [Neisseria sp. 51.81]MDD9328811.1 hypothetical protein [Neisseria sp. 51.81]
MSKLALQLVSVLDKEDLIVEIWKDENQFGEVYVENNKMQIDIFGLDKSFSSFSLCELQEAFSEAAKLLNYQIKKIT